MKSKLNVGCGKDYKAGWVNLDFNREVRADMYHDLEKKLPFHDNTFDVILVDNVLEHVKNIFPLIDELWRIAKPNATIKIYVPHFSGIYAMKHLSHYNFFGVGSFGIYTNLSPKFNGERYGEARFKVIREELLYFHHKPYYFPILAKVPINWLFNFHRIWQLFLEKFLPLKFDEIYYQLKVIK
jgi:SAM-dependent methyltransferase